MGQNGYGAFQQKYNLTAALEQYDLCMRRYFDRDLAYRTVQTPTITATPLHSPHLYESNIG